MNRRDLLSKLNPEARAVVEAQLSSGRPKPTGNVASDGYRSGWERTYAGHLETLRIAGEVAWWGHEKIRVRLGTGAWFKVDFMVIFPDGHWEAHEIKGHMREAANIRIKVAASLYPWPFFIVRPSKGGWSYVQVKP